MVIAAIWNGIYRWTEHTQTSNVYSFGVILLELFLTGGPKRHLHQLVSWVGMQQLICQRVFVY